jgi:transposase
MSTTLTFKALCPDFHDWHTDRLLTYSILLYYIPDKYNSQGVLTNAYFCGNILIEDILRRLDMGIWQERGLAIANSNTVKKNKLGWQVPSQSGNGTYIVSIDHGEPFCTCGYFETEHKKCQHIYAVEFIVQRETKPDGTVTETKTIRITYSQDWSAYNAAQTEEKAQFTQLLAELCKGVTQPEQSNGRPRLPLSDMVFASAFKVYTGFSSRRFATDVKEIHEAGLIASTPHFNSVSNYLASPELTPLLKTLIEQSASVLKSIETDFAIDSSGFSTKTYSPWYGYKYGSNRRREKWVKVHLMCGVKTHIVTSVEATAYESGDSTQLIPLLNKTAETFSINEVSADKAYSSRQNIHAIENAGGTAYIPFKGNARGMGSPTTGYDSLWHKMWHFYNFNQEVFMAHYHKRSNIESVFSMIKAKFGASVKGKTPIAQVNEVLCKVLCHNICVLIQSIHELGVEPTLN